MTYSRKARFVALAILASTACGGNSIDLDHSDSPVPVRTGDGNASLRFDYVVSVFLADDSRVYWIRATENGDQTRSCAFDDCAATATNDAQGDPLAVTQDQLFTVTYPQSSGEVSVFHCAKAGCSGHVAEFAREPLVYSGPTFAFDQEAMYWLSAFDIYRCPLSGCGGAPQLVAERLADDSGLLHRYGSALIVGGDTVYWTAPSDQGIDLYSAATDGSRAATLELHSPSLASLVLADDDHLYWLDNSNQIVSCPRTRCNEAEPKVLVATNTYKSNWAVDERGVYWLDRSNDTQLPDVGQVLFCPLSGCTGDTSPRRLSSNNVSYLSLSSQYLYWTEPVAVVHDEAGASVVDQIGSTLVRAPKPSP